MTQLKAGHIVRLPEGGVGSSGLALVTKATAEAVTVTTGTLELTYEPVQVTKVGRVLLGRVYGRPMKRRFMRTWVYVGDTEHRFDVVVREAKGSEITAVGDIRKLAFARWLEAQA